jgi:hypothetical protein
VSVANASGKHGYSLLWGNYKDRHSFENNRDIRTTGQAVLKITQSTTKKTYRFQKINNDFWLKVEFNLKSRFLGIAARKR